jgi:hypothetical protein
MRMGLMSVFRASPAQAKTAPLPEVRPAPPAPAVQHAPRTHSLSEIEAPIVERPLALRGPRGKFSLTVAGCGNEPEFNAFCYDDGKVAFYYYACMRIKEARPSALVHARSRARFASGPVPLTPKDEKRVRANIEWLIKTRDFLAPQLKPKRIGRPVSVEFIW